jgi:pimeloyl-ACP methyl ester carboxylesterase
MPAFIFNKGFVGLWLGLLLTCTFSCQRKSDFFFVGNEGAIMPVKVSGKVNSGTFLILLPGGPAGDGLVYQKVFPVFKQQLESHYAMVYYDQRGAGNCQGRYETNTLNLAQLSEDLSAVIASIRQAYTTPRIFLLAYSYGGALGITHLLKAEDRSEITGLISIAGAFDRKFQSGQQAKLIEYCLQQWQSEGSIASYKSLQAGFSCTHEANPEQCRRDSLQLQVKVQGLLQEVEQYNQFKINAGSVLRLLDFAFFSQSNPIFSGSNEALHGRYYQPEFDSLQLSEQAAELTTPILLINGRWDTNVPFFTAQEMYERIGTPVGKKKLLILEQSGHLPMLTEPMELARGIIGFVEENQAP